MTTYVLGGGCFWCIDAVFRRIKGVTSVESGYANGEGVSSYYQVASGQTGFAEVVRISFDETIIPSEIILDIFFLIHDPTTLNRQGADSGPQYRSCLLFTSVSQKRTFTDAVSRAAAIWEAPIVTEVTALENYYPAEAEHQDYFNKQPASGYCSIVIFPKILRVRATYRHWFMSDSIA